MTSNIYTLSAQARILQADRLREARRDSLARLAARCPEEEKGGCSDARQPFWPAWLRRRATA